MIIRAKSSGDPDTVVFTDDNGEVLSLSGKITSAYTPEYMELVRSECQAGARQQGQGCDAAAVHGHQRRR